MAETFIRTTPHDPKKYTTDLTGEQAETFTGADIKAVIIRRDDDTLFKAAQAYLQDVLAQAGTAQTAADLPATPVNLSKMGDLLPAGFHPKSQGDDQAKLTPLVSLQSISVSTFRAKIQVRALGQVNPRGIARGSRTIAGTLILTEFDRSVFWSMISLPLDPVPAQDWNVGDAGQSVLPDQLPSFDILLLFENERGAAAYRILYDVELVTDGIVYSIQDMYNENTLSFMATDVTPLTPIASALKFKNGSPGGQPVAGKLTWWESESITPDKSNPVKMRPINQVFSGKEVLRRYRQLKASRDPFK